MLEADLQPVLADAAELGGWRRAHFRPARTAHGWRTAGQYEAAGFPDLILVRGRDLLAWELKSERGRVSVDQLDWLSALAEVSVVDARVIRPADIDDCIARLVER